MRIKNVIISTILFMFVTLQSATAQDVIKNLGTHYGGVTFNTIQQSVKDASDHLSANPDDVYVIEIPSGEHHVAPPTNDQRIFDLSWIKPNPDGRLIIRGAGMDDTIISIPVNASHIIGRNTYRITISDIHFTRDVRQSTTQGYVVNIEPGAVTLRIPDGFPTPDTGYNGDIVKGSGRYLRRFVGNMPRIDERVSQIYWESVDHIRDNIWKFNIHPIDYVAPYVENNLIGVKQKHGGEPYRFAHGDDIRFERVRWSAESRGIFLNVDHPVVINSRVERGPAINDLIPAMSTNGGGPQIWGRGGHVVHGAVIANNVFVATGDDSIAFFNARGVIAGNLIMDSFARGIFLYNSDVILSANRLVRSPIEHRND